MLYIFMQDSERLRKEHNEMNIMRRRSPHFAYRSYNIPASSAMLTDYLPFCVCCEARFCSTLLLLLYRTDYPIALWCRFDGLWFTASRPARTASQ